MVRTQTVTILFCDLVASTERRARLGDDAFDEFTRRFMAALRDEISRHNGREVSNAGDGLMVVFPESVADAVVCAAAMHRAMPELDRLDPPMLRIGISSGEVAADGDGFSGMPIVEAARLEAAATPGQTLANAIVRALVGTRRALRFRDVGELALKGIPAPLATVEVIDEHVVDAPRPRAPARPPTPPRSRHQWRVGVAVLAALAVVAAGSVIWSRSRSQAGRAGSPAVAAPGNYVPRYAATTCPADVRAAAADATCGYLTVPQDRTKPDGPHVRLLVTSAPPRLPGPVGVPTIDVCGCEDLGNSLARDHSKLIHVGQRGFEGTPTLTCPQFVTARIQGLSRRSDDATTIERGADALRACHARLVAQRIDPAQYNFDAAARDVLDLMVAMKIPSANFIAFEAASLEVFDVLRRAPGAVKSITLDDPFPPGETLFTDPIGDLSGAFTRFAGACNTDRACGHAYPGLQGTWRADYDRANAHPAMVSAADPNDPHGVPLKVLLDGPRTADALALALRDNSLYSAIPAAITQPSSAPVVASLLLPEDGLGAGAPWGAQASYYCSYDIHTADPSAQTLAAHALPEYVRSENAQWTKWCAAWPVPDISAALSEDVVSAVPALIFRGDLSPDGNPGWIPKIERGLSNARTVIFPTLGSDLLANGPPCLSRLRVHFLADPAKALDTAGCPSPPIAFVAPTR